MTAVEAHDLTTKGGAKDVARLIEACEIFGSYCLIGLAVNCYVTGVYRRKISSIPRAVD